MMRKIIVFILCVCAVQLSAQTEQHPFTLQGTVNCADGVKVRITYHPKGQIMDIKVDSTLVQHGTFTFKGQLVRPGKAYIRLDYGNKIRSEFSPTFYLVPDAVTQVQADDSLKNFKVVNSPLNDEYQAYVYATERITGERRRTLNNKYYTFTKAQLNDTAIINPWKRENELLQQEEMKLKREYAKNNPNSYFSWLVVIGAGTDDLEIEPIFNSLDPKYRDSAEGKEFAQRLKATRATQIGCEAPLFTQNDPKGKPVKLTDFRGKYVLIDFWASWCGPCRKENPNVVKAYNTYHKKGFEVLGISLDGPKGRDNWLEAIKKDKLTWTQVSDLKGWDNEVSKMYDIHSIPANFLIDPQGKIIAHNLRGPALEKFLEGIFDKK